MFIDSKYDFYVEKKNNIFFQLFLTFYSGLKHKLKPEKKNGANV